MYIYKVFSRQAELVSNIVPSRALGLSKHRVPTINQWGLSRNNEARGFPETDLEVWP